MAYYDRYRGSRRRRRNRIRALVLGLLLLVVLAAAALFFFGEHAVFTYDGFRFPFTRQEEPDASDPVPSDEEPGDYQLEIEEPDAEEPSVDADEPVAGDPAQPVRTQALLVTGEALLTDKEGLLERFSRSGCAQLAFVVKTPDGLSLVDDDDVSDGVSDQAAVFALELDSLEMGKVAVISALRDNVRPRVSHRSSALKLESGSTWLDREYYAWFDPAGEDTLSCLLATVRACEAAGFEQVVLDNFCYPTAGKLELLDYGDAEARREALTALAQGLREGTRLQLGLILTETAALELRDEVSGQDVAALAPYFDRVYVPDVGADPSLSDAAVAGTDCRVGLYLTGSSEQATAGLERDCLLEP